MKFDITFEEQLLMKGFVQICTNPDYSEGKLKRYRILYFAYVVGCVGSDELAFIFRKDGMLNDSIISTQRNLNRSILNGLAKTSKESAAKLKKLENGYYVITPAGTESLIFHLIEKGWISHEMYEYYMKHANYHYVNSQHACMIGRALLSYFRYEAGTYLFEPVFSENAELLFGTYEHEKGAYLIPDGIMSDKEGEVYFIEADSGHERMRTKLIPKIQRYINSVCKEAGSSEILLTLHFYLWDSKASKNESEFDIKTLNDLYLLYDFQVNYLHNEIPFPDFLVDLMKYPVSKNSILFPVQKLLSSFDLKQIKCTEDLEKMCVKKTLITEKKTSIISRKKSLSDVAKYIPEFRQYLYRGMRYICTSSNTTNEVLKCIYFERYMIQNIIKIIEENIAYIDRVIGYKRIKKYYDNITGEIYWFRNVIECVIDGEKADIIIENIEDDLGGKVRVERILNEIKISMERRMMFLLILSDENKINFDIKIDDIKNKFETIIFSYSDWIMLNK